VQALKSRNARKVKMVAFDSSDQLVANCRAGWIDSLVVQDPFRMGYESTLAVVKHLRGESAPEYVDSGVRLVRRDDLDKPEVKALLFPDIQKYLKQHR
jgi:ribose transport system substrate-binding protein